MVTEPYAQQLIAEGKAMVRAAGVDNPVYIIDACFSQYLSGLDVAMINALPESYLACTSPVYDLSFQHSALQYEWQGRGPCMLFRKPILQMPRETVLGVVLHEVGHWLQFAGRPERDDPDGPRAIATWRKGGIPRDSMHDWRWLRATVHVWWRACAAGYDIPFGQVVNLGQYGFTNLAIKNPLIEARLRADEPLDQVIQSAPMSVQTRATRPAPARSAPTPSASRSASSLRELSAQRAMAAAGNCPPLPALR